MNLDFSSNTNVSNSTEAVQAMWDKIFPKETQIFPGNNVNYLSASGAGTIIANSQVIKRTGNVGSSCEVCVYFEDMIDITYLSNITIKFNQISWTGSTDNGVVLSISSTKPDTVRGSSNGHIASTSRSSTSGSFIKSLDVSTYTGYVYIYLWSIYWDFEINYIKLS